MLLLLVPYTGHQTESYMCRHIEQLDRKVLRFRRPFLSPCNVFCLVFPRGKPCPYITINFWRFLSREYSTILSFEFAVLFLSHCHLSLGDQHTLQDCKPWSRALEGALLLVLDFCYNPEDLESNFSLFPADYHVDTEFYDWIEPIDEDWMHGTTWWWRSRVFAMQLVGHCTWVMLCRTWDSEILVDAVFQDRPIQFWPSEILLYV